MNTLVLTCPDCGSIDITTVIENGQSEDRCEMCGFIGVATETHASDAIERLTKSKGESR